MPLSVRRSLPPVAAWLAALAVVTITAAAGNHDPFHWTTWSHWDSGHYESIARHGYEVHHCTPHDAANGHATWCGNTAWFPAYPLTIAVVHEFGPSIGVSGMIVSWTCALAALVILWYGFLVDERPASASVALAYGALMPGLVYLYAVFPMSMFVALTLLCVAMLARRRWVAAGAAGFAAAVTYPVGVMVLPVVALVAAIRSRRARALIPVAAPLAAFAFVVVVERVQTGRWSAFFAVQAHYHHGFHNPAGVTSNTLLVLWRAPQAFSYALAAYWQMTLVVVVVAAVVVAAIVRRSRLTRLDELLVTVAVAGWALPLTQDHVSVWRSETVLAPVAVLVGRLPRPVGAIIAAAAAVVGVAAARLFFDNGLI